MKKSIKKKKALQIYQRIRNIVFGIVIAVLTVFVVLIMCARISGGTPTIFGYSLFRVSSGSMVPELKIGDVILTSECDGNLVKTGDIVTYKSTSGSMKGKLITHRVIKDPYDNNGKKYVVTKGDANSLADSPIATSQIQSKLLTKISVLSFIYNAFLTPWGLLLIIGLIIFAFFNEIVILVKAIIGIGYEKEKTESVEDIIKRYQEENNEEKLADLSEESEEDSVGGE